MPVSVPVSITLISVFMLISFRFKKKHVEVKVRKVAFLEDLSPKAVEIALATKGPIAVEIDAEDSFHSYNSGSQMYFFWHIIIKIIF